MKSLQSRLVALTPLWLFMFAPFLLFPGSTKVPALLGLPLLWWLNKREKGYFVRRTPFDWAILVMLVMVLVSEYATFDLNFSLPSLSGLLLGIALFYVVVETISTRQGLRWTLAIFFLFGLMILGVGILDTRWMYKVALFSSITNRLPSLSTTLPVGTIHPNVLAGTLLWIFPLQAAIGWYIIRQKPAEIPRWMRWTLWVMFGLTLGVFVLTQSRGGWVGGIVALVVLGALLNRLIRWGAVIGGVGAVIAVTVIGWQKIGELLVSDTTEAMVGNLGSLGFRQEVWRAALWGLSDFPFTGMGMGTFRKVSRELYPINAFPIDHAHNQLLQVGVDLGIPGLVAFLAIWLIAGWLLWQTIRRTEDEFIKAVAMGIAASLSGYFVFALADTTAFSAKPGFFLWWLFALAAGVYMLADDRAREYSGG